MVLLTSVLDFVHILFGVVWIGSAFYVTFVVFPVGKKMSPRGRAELVIRLVPIAGPFELISSVLTLVFGVLLAYDMSGGNLSPFTSTSWGEWITAGAVFGLTAFVVGTLLILPEARRFQETLKQIEAQPSEDRSKELDGFIRKLDRLGYGSLTFLLLTLVAMVSAATA